MVLVIKAERTPPNSEGTQSIQDGINLPGNLKQSLDHLKCSYLHQRDTTCIAGLLEN